MTRMLRLSTALCGSRATHAVIEPLLADWQRQLATARMDGAISTAVVTASGGLALFRSLIACAIAEGVWIPPLRGTVLSMLAIAFSIVVSIATLLIAAPAYAHMSRSPADPLTQGYLLMMASSILPPAFLLAMFMHRRDPRSTLRHGLVGVTLTAVVMLVVAMQTNPEKIYRRFNTFEFQEQMRAQMIAAAKSNPDIWKGRSLERTLATTVEERRATYQRMEARFAEMRKNDPPPTWSDRFAQVQPVLLAVVLAAMGWTLGGVRRPTIPNGLFWWSLVFIATIVMTNLFSLLVGVPMPRPPQWAMSPVFASLTVLLIVASRRRWLGGGDYQ